jgi:hypothetical protein
MQETLDRLRTVLEAELPRLRALSEEASARPSGAGKWCPREVLGHLVDSASNNHQRFVRAQLALELRFPPYEQEGWISVQRYRDEPWEAIVALFAAYNRHLLHVMAHVPESCYPRRCDLGSTEPGTLGELMVDYVRHLEHHLAQIP